MAEAHLAVAFSFTITHDGVNISYNREVLQMIWQSGWRSWKKRYARLINNLKSGVYPASPISLIILTFIITFLQFLSYDVSYGITKTINTWLPEDRFTPFLAFLTTCVVFSFILWISIIVIMRQTLKLLLIYKGWIYDSNVGNKVSLKTKIWAMVVKLLEGNNTPLLYSLQSSMPRQPVPSLEDTIKRYLTSMRPLLKDEDYENREKLALDFQQGVGKKLQWFLWLKSWWASNYISDWWEEYVYLRGRDPLLINSNYYGVDRFYIPNCTQSSRTATFIHNAFLFRRAIERQTLKPLMIRNLIPLCSWQYERVFNTTRVPGIETDKIVHYSDSQHIVVRSKGNFYKVLVYNKNRLLSSHEIQWQLEWILQDDYKSNYGEEHVGALTTTDRVTWARARKEYFSRGMNKISLDIIEKAAFFVILDEESYDIDDPKKGDVYVKNLLHGKGYNFWMDKSFTLIVGKNGRMGLNLEHSYADGPVLAQMWEYCLSFEFLYQKYNDEGRIEGDIADPPPLPTRLKWELEPDCVGLIRTCTASALNLISDVDQRLYIHNDFGKNFIKTCGVSPDAYIQMALQLAYFRDSGKFGLTYESSMLRLFREGRTETVRSVTKESCAWARAMEDPTCTDNMKIQLFKNACEVHQIQYREAMCGRGVDRHLFCLYVVSKYLEVDSPFLQEFLHDNWRLSTSQTPHHQMSLYDINKHPDFIAGGGGFGPVVDNGYGVAYMICGNDVIVFHISSKFSCKCTDSLRLLKTLRNSMLEIKQLFENTS
ncbi:carnitine O-palmitoyltransferase 1, liver isoform-like [Centruroides sculpturatus]|uniref:carnitine O-palmitoyltransferase 1, liver isoform-like n=1 Tax=Centruroides sculpturatus TaxID=218467 RepID=UPI000C6DCFE9|nr:carnitine O-palmitoyltransferase 1, liver isoform-like [Centruroides sculpturatus]XP_023225084.1 carnitine O-palmitoyltransferase 1, liver isoform-like [Centruroides sculpturatus]